MAQLQQGKLVASVDEAREILKEIGAKVEKDPSEMTRFKANMGQYLGEHGLAQPIQHEIFREANIDPALGCTFSCVCTGCGIATLSV